MTWAKPRLHPLTAKMLQAVVVMKEGLVPRKVAVHNWPARMPQAWPPTRLQITCYVEGEKAVLKEKQMPKFILIILYRCYESCQGFKE